MRSARPRYRAHALRAVLEAAGDLPQREAIFAAIPPEDALRVRASKPLAWLDAAILPRIYDGIRVGAGPEAVRACGRSAVAAMRSVSILDTMLRHGLELFGPSPTALLPLYPRAMGMVTRNVGTIVVRVESEDRYAAVQWFDLPDCLRSSTWILGAAGALHGALDMIGTHGVVEPDDHDLSNGWASFRVRWEAA